MKSGFKTNGNDAMFETEAQEIDMAGVTSLPESAPAQRNRYNGKIVRQIQIIVIKKKHTKRRLPLS